MSAHRSAFRTSTRLLHFRRQKRCTSRVQSGLSRQTSTILKLPSFEYREEIEIRAVGQGRRHRHHDLVDRGNPNVLRRLEALGEIGHPRSFRNVHPHGSHPLRKKPAEIAMHVNLDGNHVSSRRSAPTIFSAVIGNEVIRTPVADAIALAIVAGGWMQGGSPTPFAPYGPAAEAHSTRMQSMSGT